MKSIGAQLAYFLSERQSRRKVLALFKYLIFLGAVVALFSILFHVIMLNVENREFSWLTGVYWTLTVMSTLGFGDITFNSDLGRLFSIVVLLTGIVLLLIMLPFVFISYFYAPWLEAQVRLEAPRRVPTNTTGHVIITRYDSVAAGLIEKLKAHDIPYVVIESDVVVAGRMHGEGISVVTGEIDSRHTYEALNAASARLLVANCSDAVNTNIALTVREHAPDVPIVALAEEQDSIDILELAGCTHVLPLKQRLGEQLANRISARHAQAHVVGTLGGLQIAEFPVHSTPLAGRRIRELSLREAMGIQIIGVWERGRLLPVHLDLELSDRSVVVVAGTPDQLLALNSFLVIYDTNYNPVLIIGGGKVGCAIAQAVKLQGVPVHLVESDPGQAEKVRGIPDQLFIGDAADREVLHRAGLHQAPSVILSTNDDATNIYLTVYCRRLNPHLRIVSRITYERNLEAVHRAGADFVLSYASVGAESLFAILQGRNLVMLAEGIQLFHVLLPASLAGKTLAETQMATRTGLTVLAIEREGVMVSNPPATQRLEAGSQLAMIGSQQQLRDFTDAYG